jgi:hypothetical protein
LIGGRNRAVQRAALNKPIRNKEIDMKKINFGKASALVLGVTAFVFTGCSQSIGGISGPALTGKVEINGDARVGRPLTAVVSELDAAAEALQKLYQWQRSDAADAGWADIAVAAAGENYTLTGDDVGKYIRVLVSVPGYRGSIAPETPVGPVMAALANTYAITGYTGTNGSVSANPAPAEAGATVTLTVSPGAGYTLTEDSLTVTGASGTITPAGSGNTYTFTMPGEAVTVTADFTALATGTYSINTVPTAGGNISTGLSAAAGVTVTLTVNANAGYTYTANSLTVTYDSNQTITPPGSGPTYTFTMPAANVTVQAGFTAIPYNITVNVNPANSGSVTANPTTATVGAQVTLTVTPNHGYKLKTGGLKVNDGAVPLSGSGPTYTFTMPVDNVTVQAEFEAEPGEDNTDSATQGTKNPTIWTHYVIDEMKDFLTMNTVAYGKGIGFVIGSGTDLGAGGSGYPVFATSVNAGTANSWTVTHVTNVLPQFNSFAGKIRRLNNKFIATRGSGPDVAIISDDGVNWTLTSTGFGTKGFAYGEGISLIGGQKGQIAYSTDGMATWTKQTASNTGLSTSGSNGYINAAAYGNGRFVIGGGLGRTAVSTDKCLTWTMCPLTGATSPKSIFDSGFIDSMIYFKGKFIALGAVDGEPAKSAYSTDGLNWTQGGSPPDLKTGSDTSPMMAQGAGYLIAVDLQGKAAYSTDGINWISCGNTKFDGNPIKDIAYGNGRFVIVGAGGRVSYCDVY